MPASSAISPTPNVRFPHQSRLTGRRSPSSRSFRYAQNVPNSPNGTDTRKTRCHSTGPSSPPTTRPMKDPAIPATWFRPRASPRWSGGKASVRIAAEFANSIAPPTPCSTLMRISHSTPAVPCIQVSDSTTENSVNTAKPRL